MWRIAKSFSFSASHQLTHLAPEHPCARLHGHNYTVVLILQGEQLDPETNMLVDFRALERVKRWLDETFDHRHLNDVMGPAHLTTSEGLACAIYSVWSVEFPELICVRVRETDKTMAEYWKPVPPPAPTLDAAAIKALIAEVHGALRSSVISPTHLHGL